MRISYVGLVARARGMGEIAKKAGLNRESLYKALGETGNPEFSTVMRVVRALGLTLSARPRASGQASKRRRVARPRLGAHAGTTQSHSAKSLSLVACRLDRAPGRGVIASRRSISAHLRPPRRRMPNATLTLYPYAGTLRRAYLRADKGRCRFFPSPVSSDHRAARAWRPTSRLSSGITSVIWQHAASDRVFAPDSQPG